MHLTASAISHSLKALETDPADGPAKDFVVVDFLGSDEPLVIGTEGIMELDTTRVAVHHTTRAARGYRLRQARQCATRSLRVRGCAVPPSGSSDCSGSGTVSVSFGPDNSMSTFMLVMPAPVASSGVTDGTSLLDSRRLISTIGCSDGATSCVAELGGAAWDERVTIGKARKLAFVVPSFAEALAAGRR